MAGLCPTPLSTDLTTTDHPMAVNFRMLKKEHTDIMGHVLHRIFLLSLANSHRILVGKYPLILYLAPEPAPVDQGLSQRKVKGTSVLEAGSSSACLALSGSVVPWTK